MYDQFNLQRALADFGLTFGSVRNLFPGIGPVAVPPEVRRRLRAFAELANTEAGRILGILLHICGVTPAAAAA